MREREKKKENNLKLIIAINHEIIDIINYIYSQKNGLEIINLISV